MRRTAIVAIALVVALALAPGLAFARAGAGSSMGSRGSMTFSRPPATSTAPYSAAPMERSLTQPGYGSSSSGYQPGYAGYGTRSPFMSGLLGGLLGAGIGGLLFGHGLFGGISGFGSFLGFLLQIFLLVMIVRFILRLIFRQPAFAGPGIFPRSAAPGMTLPSGSGGAPLNRVTITPADYQAFEQALQGVQAAWSAHDLNALRALATPEMVSYFAEQLAEQSSQGVRNTVTDVRLEQGDLAEAWSERGRDYASVAMRFSMIDVTRDASGRVVEGDAVRRTQATEMWTFLRAPGGGWILSAMQQAR